MPWSSRLRGKLRRSVPDGTATIVATHAATITRHILRALLVSGYTHDILTQHDVDDSKLQFLPKPFSGQALQARVREVLDAP